MNYEFINRTVDFIQSLLHQGSSGPKSLKKFLKKLVYSKNKPNRSFIYFLPVFQLNPYCRNARSRQVPSPQPRIQSAGFSVSCHFPKTIYLIRVYTVSWNIKGSLSAKNICHLHNSIGCFVLSRKTRSFINMLNRTGPSMDPWGIPEVISCPVECRTFPIFTRCPRLERQSHVQRYFILTPDVCSCV